MADAQQPAAAPERRRLVVASEGRPITSAVIARAVELARPGGADVLVVSVARVWGTSLGFPNPWLLPSRREWEAQREIAAAAVKALQKAGLSAQARVVGTRRPGKRIVTEAARFGATAIVMGADPRRRLIGDLSWSQEPHRVVRRSKRIPVHLVVAEPRAAAARPARR
ncbi:MAG TPA: universal stress protein [Gaiellales bacterium]|nr:universal stress protein [Gaiellales bacterium]